MAVRKARAWALINGQRIEAMELNAACSRTKKADTFSGRLPLFNGPLSPTFWLDAAEIKDVSIYMQAESAEGREVIKGDIEQVTCDFAQGTVHFTGKDKTAALINEKTTEKFLNKKSTEIVKELAGRAGVDVKVTESTLKAGKLYQIDFNKITDHVSMWTAINEMADKEGYDVFMKDGVLQFVDENDDEGEIQIDFRAPTPEQFATGNFVHLRVARNLNLSKPHKVRVQSWDSKKKEKIVSEKHIGGTGKERLYDYKYDELTKDRADRMAEKHLERNMRHEKEIQLTGLPGDETITPRMMLALSGTQSSFDQSYYIKTIEHAFSRGGYAQNITAHNKDERRK